MPLRCSVCRKPDLQEINIAITRGDPERTIAARYGLSKPAVHRHKGCIAAAADEARKVNAAVTLATASDELARHRHRARKLEAAIDEWLTDPDNPERFNLSPRANEIPVVYISQGENGKPQRKKAKLSELLEMVESTLGITVSYADTSGVADARRLFVDLMRTTNAQVELLGRLSGEFISEKKHPEDAAREASRIDLFKRLIDDFAAKHQVSADAAKQKLFQVSPELRRWSEGDKVIG